MTPELVSLWHLHGALGDSVETMLDVAALAGMLRVGRLGLSVVRVDLFIVPVAGKLRIRSAAII